MTNTFVTFLHRSRSFDFITFELPKRVGGADWLALTLHKNDAVVRIKNRHKLLYQNVHFL